MIRLYVLKTCDTCRKAIKAIEATGREFKILDLRADGVTKAQIARWAEEAGWETLLNKSSTTWRSLADAEKEGLSKAKAIALMAAHPTLIKRPVIEAKGKLFLGWGEETRKALG